MSYPLMACIIIAVAVALPLLAAWWIDRRRTRSFDEFNSRRTAAPGLDAKPHRYAGHVPPRPMPMSKRASSSATHWRPNRPLTPVPVQAPAASDSSVSDAMMNMMLAQQMLAASTAPRAATCDGPEPAPAPLRARDCEWGEPAPPPRPAYEWPAPSPSYDSGSSSCSSDYSSSSDSGSSSSD